MKTAKELLELFPEHKPIVFHCSMDDIITPIFTHYDRVELEERLVDRHNKDNQQGVLFL
jgi:hypothetical protein